MDAIKLILPTEEYLDQVWAYRREMLDAGSSMDGTSALGAADTPAAWLDEVALFSNPATVPDGWVQTTQFLGVRQSDGKLVGMLQVRHSFNEFLEKFGGHIGYSTRPGERRKGCAKEMLRLALPFCRELGLNRVLVSCQPDNPGSRRAILANGGVYESTVHEPEENIDLERYWIALP